MWIAVIIIHPHTWISLAWYITMSPRRIAVERLIRPFRTYEYMESCKSWRQNMNMVIAAYCINLKTYAEIYRHNCTMNKVNIKRTTLL